MTAIGLPGGPVPELPGRGRKRPKGLVPYQPRAGSENARILGDAQAALDRYRAQDRLPLGSREIGYVLTGDEYGWTHDHIDRVEDVLVRARRAGLVAWSEVSDGRTASARPWAFTDAETLVDQIERNLDAAQLDRQVAQAVRVEMWCEAAGWLTRLEMICTERGVTVYSGSGSVPVDAIRQAVLRAGKAAGRTGARTVLLQAGDLDLAGIRNIARPFAEDVEAFASDFGLAPGTVIVRRILLTGEQVEEHVGKRGRGRPSAEAIRAGWPWDFTAQAEALPPEIRDRIVEEAIDALHDLSLRQSVIDAEAAFREEARHELRARLDDR